jgi:hypothetical protein
VRLHRVHYQPPRILQQGLRREPLFDPHELTPTPALPVEGEGAGRVEARYVTFVPHELTPTPALPPQGGGGYENNFATSPFTTFPSAFLGNSSTNRTACGTL